MTYVEWEFGVYTVCLLGYISLFERIVKCETDAGGETSMTNARAECSCSVQDVLRNIRREDRGSSPVGVEAKD